LDRGRDPVGHRWNARGDVSDPCADSRGRTFHDDGIYLVTAKALAEDHGYRIISVPGEPPQTKYPILFPWLVSLVWRLYPSFPVNLPWLRLVPLLASLAWLGLSWILLRRLGASRPEASTIVLLTVVSPWVAFLSTAIMSETLFAAFFTAGLLMIVRIDETERTRTYALAAGLLLGAAVITRTAGLAPALAAAAFFAVKKQWRSATQYVAGIAVVTLPWFWWVAQQNAAATSLDPYYSAANYASWNVLTNYEVADKLRVIATNVLQIGLSLIYIWQIDIPAVLALTVAAAGLALLAAAFWRARREPVVLLIAAYGAIHIAWVWPPLRFVIPVVPLLLWFAFVGAGRPRKVGSAVAVVMCLVSAFQLSGMVAQARENGIASPFTEADNWNRTASLLAWVSRETPTDAVLAGNLDPAYYLFTGRKAVRAFAADPLLLYYERTRSENPLGTVDDFRNRLLAIKADYLIVTPAPGFGEVPHLNRLIAALSNSRAGSLVPVAGSEDSGHVIYRIDRSCLEDRDAVTARP
jgi:hypothetical protein